MSSDPEEPNPKPGEGEPSVSPDPIPGTVEANAGRNRGRVEPSGGLLCVHDLEGRLLSVNPESARQVGYTVEELLRIPMRELIPPEFHPQFDEYLKKIARDGEAHGLLTTLARSGERRVWEYHNKLRTEGVPAPVVQGVAHDVTDRRRVDRELRKTAEGFRLLEEYAPALAMFDHEMRYLYASRRWRTDYGLGDRDLRGVSHYEVFPEIPERWKQFHRRALSGEALREENDRFDRADGSTQWIRWEIRPWYDTPHTVGGIVIFTEDVTDITERKRSEASLRESEARLRLAQEVTKIGVFERNLKTDEVRWSPEMGDLHGLAPTEYPKTLEALLQHVHPEDRAYFQDEIQKSIETGDGDGEWRVVWPDSTVHWIAGRWHAFRDEQGRSLRLLGMDFDITERKQAEERLREYERVVENLEEMIAVVNRDYRYVLANRAFLAYRALTKEEVVGRTAAEVVNPEAFEIIKEKLDEAFRGRVVSYEMSYRYPEKGDRDLSVTYLPVEGPTGVDRVACVLQDITERKNAERALQKSAAELHEAQRLGRMGSWYRDLETDALTWSEQVDCVLGSDPKTQLLTFAQAERFFSPESWQRLVQTNRKLVSSGGTDELEVEFRRQDGTAGWAIIHREAVRDEAGKIVGIRGVALDITERRLAEQDLRENEERLRLAHEAARIGVFERDMQAGGSNWTAEVGKMYGIEPETAPRSVDELLQLVHPADHEPLQRMIAESIETGASGGEWRVIWPDGSVHWISGRWRMFKDEQGRPLRALGVNVDITERKRAEQALRESEERMRLAEEAARIGSFERNMQTGESYWSPQTEEMFGLQPGAGPKSLPEFFHLIHPADREHVEHLLAESVTTGSVAGEWRVIWPDGSVHWIDGRWKVFKDEQGRPLRAIGIDSDITERKRIEEELRQAKEKLTEEKLYLEHAIDSELGFEEIIGKSAGMKAVLELVARVASSDATVLLLGETGVGKELVARAIHRLSKRAGNAFIKTNCAAIPTGLLESELFGAEKGAYTGSVSRKIGRLELADKGTLFLDEIGEIALALQPKLLRVLQDQEFERLGGTQTLRVDFRLIAATNRDLAHEVQRNQFRSDLFYRLNVFPIVVPPLRERRDDIPLLVEHFVRKCAGRMKKSITSIPRKTMAALTAWDWPGNVRELENFIERSIILTNGSVLAAPLGELQARLSAQSQAGTLEAAERKHILEALRQSKGRISGEQGAAARLGLKRTTLQSKLKQLRINPRTPPPS